MDDSGDISFDEDAPISGKSGNAATPIVQKASATVSASASTSRKRARKVKQEDSEEEDDDELDEDDVDVSNNCCYSKFLCACFSPNIFICLLYRRRRSQQLNELQSLRQLLKQRLQRRNLLLRKQL